MQHARTILLAGVLGLLLCHGLWGSFTVLALADPTGKSTAGDDSYDTVAARYLAVREQLPDVPAMGYVNSQPMPLRQATFEFGLARWAAAPITLTPTPAGHRLVLASFWSDEALQAALDAHGLRVHKPLSESLYLLEQVQP